jgi:hypothetical protein
MKTILRHTELAFSFLEELAKDVNIQDSTIREFLVYYLTSSGYQRSPFNMVFNRLLRGRAVTGNTVEDACYEFRHVNRLSYPPPASNPPASRCNPEGRSVFYCSIDSGVPIFEVRAELGQYVALTTFKHKQNQKIVLRLPIIGVEHIHDNLLLRDPSNPMVKILEQDIYYKTNGNIRTIELDRRLSKWFSEPVDDSNRHIYRLTNAYYEAFIRHATDGYNGRVKGLIYPSIESESTGYNIVLETDLVDDILEVEACTIFKVESKVGKKYALSQKKQIDYLWVNGDIAWEDFVWHLEPHSPSFSYG